MGAKRPDQLDDSVGATEVALSAADMADLNAVTAPPLEYPVWMQRARVVPPRPPLAVQPAAAD